MKKDVRQGAMAVKELGARVIEMGLTARRLTRQDRKTQFMKMGGTN